MRHGMVDGSADTEQLDEVVERARRRWPKLELSRDRLAAWAEDSGLAFDGGEAVGWEELALALECAAGNEVALRVFDRQYLAKVPSMLASFRLGRDELADLVQRLRERLLLSRANGPPRIADYSGRGSLSGFVKVAATRLALNDQRGDKESNVARDEFATIIAPDDLEFAGIERESRAQLAHAVETALAELEPKARTLLRLHLLDGLTFEEIGSLYEVNRSTAFRRFVKARGELESQLRVVLAARLAVSESQVDQVVDVLQSHLDLSLERLLASRSG